MNEKASKTNIETPKLEMLAVSAMLNHATGDSSPRSLRQAANANHDHPREREGAHDPGLDEDAEPLVVEDRGVGLDAGPVLAGDPRCEALAEHRLWIELLVQGRRQGRDAPAADICVRLLGDEAALREERVGERSKRAGNRKVDHHDHGNEHRPVAANLARAETEERHDADREHQEARS